MPFWLFVPVNPPVVPVLVEVPVTLVFHTRFLRRLPLLVPTSPPLS